MTKLGYKIWTLISRQYKNRHDSGGSLITLYGKISAEDIFWMCLQLLVMVGAVIAGVAGLVAAVIVLFNVSPLLVTPVILVALFIVVMIKGAKEYNRRLDNPDTKH